MLAALLAAFVPLVALTVGVVIWEGYRKSRQAAMDAGNQLFQSHQTEVALQQQALFGPLRFAVSTFAADPGFGGGESERYLRAFMSVLQRYPHVSGIHAGYDNGELFEVIATRGTNPKPGMPEKTAFVVHIITANATSPTDTWRFLDAVGVELSRQTQAGMSYDPRNRAWYRSALAAPNDIVETMPYVIDVIDEPGVSVAHAFAGARSGVIAADVPLAQLSAIVGGLAADENEQLFLFLGNGKLLAHADLAMLIGSGPYDASQPFQLPDADALTNPVAQAMLHRFHTEGVLARVRLKSTESPT